MNYSITPYIREIFSDIIILCEMSKNEIPRHFELCALKSIYNEEALVFHYGRINIYQDLIQLKIKTSTTLKERFKFNIKNKLLLSYDVYTPFNNIGFIMEFNIKYNKNFEPTIELIREILNNYLY